MTRSCASPIDIESAALPQLRLKRFSARLMEVASLARLRTSHDAHDSSASEMAMPCLAPFVPSENQSSASEMVLGDPFEWHPTMASSQALASNPRIVRVLAMLVKRSTRAGVGTGAHRHMASTPLGLPSLLACDKASVVLGSVDLLADILCMSHENLHPRLNGTKLLKALSQLKG